MTHPHQMHDVSISGIIWVQSRFFDPFSQFLHVTQAGHSNIGNGIFALHCTVNQTILPLNDNSATTCWCATSQTTV